MKGDSKLRGFATRAIHAGQQPEPVTGAVNVPIFQTSTYVQPELGAEVEYDYARVKNPTRTALEDNVTSLESGVGGHAFASGMAALTALFTTMRSDEHVVVSHNVYGGTYRLLEQVLDRYRLRASWIDTTDLDAVSAAIQEETRWVLIESPTNPMMDITDISAVCDCAHARGAKVAVDNTFLSPYFQRPIELGADLVMHSATKYLGGHSDCLGGLLVTNNPADSEWFAFVQKSAGAILAPFEAYLILRGIKTLPVRMERHETNARLVVDALAEHPKVERLYYPGQSDHPGHQVQKRQATGFGAMVSFDVGSYERAKLFLDNLEVITLAESLGGVESLACHPATMTHAAIPQDELDRLGITGGLVRISVGLEDGGDLVADVALRPWT